MVHGHGLGGQNKSNLKLEVVCQPQIRGGLQWRFKGGVRIDSTGRSSPGYAPPQMIIASLKREPGQLNADHKC